MKCIEVRRSSWSLAVRAALTGVVLAWASSATGCNTVKGIGHDITAVGEGGQQLIDDAAGNGSSRRR